MTRLPSFQFYPADWRANAKLRSCGAAARGAWIDIMCVLHESDEYGVVRWPLVRLAKAADVRLAYAQELASNGVLRGGDACTEPYIFTPFHAGQYGEPRVLVQPDGKSLWYSPRMVRDHWMRSRRGINTRFSAENPSPKWTPTQRQGDGAGDGAGDGLTSSSSASAIAVAKATAHLKSPTGDFEAFWQICPRKVGKGAARKAYAKALAQVEPGELLNAMRRYAATRRGEDEAFTVHPSTWLNQERWLDGKVATPVRDQVWHDEQAQLKKLGLI